MGVHKGNISVAYAEPGQRLAEFLNRVDNTPAAVKGLVRHRYRPATRRCDATKPVRTGMCCSGSCSGSGRNELEWRLMDPLVTLNHLATSGIVIVAIRVAWVLSNLSARLKVLEADRRGAHERLDGIENELKEISRTMTELLAYSRGREDAEEEPARTD